MMRCQQLTQHASDYIDKQLPIRKRLALRGHLLLCKACRTYMEQMRATKQTLRRIPKEPVSKEVLASLTDHFERMHPAASKQGQRGWGFLEQLESFGARYGLLTIAALLAITTLGLIASGVQAGELGVGTHCLVSEAAYGTGFVALLGLLALSRHTRFSTSTWMLVATAGALVGFGVVSAECPASHMAAHALVFHVGGIAVAACLGLFSSRLLRRA